MIAHALCACEHGGVVGQHYGTVAVDGGGTCDHAVGGRVGGQVFGAAPARLRGDGQCAVFAEAARVAQVGQVLTGAALALCVALGHGVAAGGVFGLRQAGLQSGQISAQAVCSG